MITNPDFLIRPDDFAIFKSNNDGTYSIIFDIDGDDSHTGAHKHKKSILTKLGFTVAAKEDLKGIRKKQDQYHAKLIARLEKNKGCGE